MQCRKWVCLSELGILFGVAGAALLGLAMGLLAVRRQGIYFTMITLALAQMLYFVCVQVPYTHGEDGTTDIPRGKLLGMFDLSNDLLDVLRDARIDGGWLCLDRADLSIRRMKSGVEGNQGKMSHGLFR